MDESITVSESLKQEIEMLSKLRHPNLVLFIGICTDAPLFSTDRNIRTEHNTVILTELLPCSLYDILEVKKAELDLADVLDIALDIANGLNYLHRHSPSIIHRDISAKNILIGGNRAKIADLGQAKIFGESALSRQTGMPGAMAYSAPEVLTGKYSEKIDIFSFGVLMCQMCTGEYPRIDKREEQISKAISKYGVLKHLLISTISYQPRDRPTSTSICESLELIKSNDRYYPTNRKIQPEKDIGILPRHWMKEQMENNSRDVKIALEQTSRRLLLLLLVVVVLVVIVVVIVVIVVVAVVVVIVLVEVVVVIVVEVIVVVVVVVIVIVVVIVVEVVVAVVVVIVVVVLIVLVVAIVVVVIVVVL